MYANKTNMYLFIASIIIVVGDFQGGKKPVRGGGGVVGRDFFFQRSPLPNKSLLAMYKEACEIGTCNFFRQVMCIFKIVE